MGGEARESGRREQFKRQLKDQQFAEELFPSSTRRLNPDIGEDDFKRYTSELAEYSDEKVEATSLATDFFVPGNPNIGFKLHLNVPIADVRRASEYLRAQGIHHKYLFGGEIDQGKIFTIYTGSKNKTDEVAKKVSADMSDWLCRPADRDEIEFAPNVIGRFAAINVHVKEDLGSDRTWHQYGNGLRGVPMLWSDCSQFGPWGIKPGDKDYQPALLEAFDRTYAKLANQFGPYFYGNE